MDEKIDDELLYNNLWDVVLYYSIDDNNISNEFGMVIYNLWDYFWPNQIYNFKKNLKPTIKLKTKQGNTIELVCV